MTDWLDITPTALPVADAARILPRGFVISRRERATPRVTPV
ncbi:hypothetical protein [Variovorax sp. Varisp62]